MKLHNLFDLYILQKNQWRSPEAIKQIQKKKLKKLVKHAYQNVPYYRELFDSLKIKPQDIRKLEDLYLIPLTSKEQMQELSLTEKIAENIDIKGCKSSTTSGTTGIPLKIYSEPADRTSINLSWIRAFLTSGMRPWYKMAAFSGERSVNEKKSWYEYLGLMRRKEISNWDKPEIWIEKLRKWKPHVLAGDTVTLKLLGEAVQESQIKDISLKMIFNSAVLMDDFSRQFLESVFQSKIIDIYGSDEGGCLAWECEKCSGYHICSDMVIVEILENGKPVSPGQEGEVVITNLHSYAMPFIRYKQEDVVVLSKKKPVCGRSFPLLEHIMGRTEDFIILRNGRKIPPQPFYHAIKTVTGVRKWRIVQESIDKLTVRIEPQRDFDRYSRQMIESNLNKLLKDEIKIEIFLVDSIPRDPSLKFRTVSSKMRGNF